MHCLPRRRAITGCIVFTVIALTTGVILSQSASPFRVFVLDSGARIVRSVALPDGPVTDSPRFEEATDLMLASPDGSRLVVFHEPELQGMTWTKDVAIESRADETAIRRPKKAHAVSVVETRGMTVVGRIEDVGWNASPIRPRFVAPVRQPPRGTDRSLG
jgi:hypothetical protein